MAAVEVRIILRAAPGSDDPRNITVWSSRHWVSQGQEETVEVPDMPGLAVTHVTVTALAPDPPAKVPLSDYSARELIEELADRLDVNLEGDV